MPPAGTIRLSVRVSPGSTATDVSGYLDDGSVKITLRSGPVDGRANSELITFLARAFGTDRGSVKIVTGGRSRRKLVRIEGVTRMPGWFREESGD